MHVISQMESNIEPIIIISAAYSNYKWAQSPIKRVRNAKEFYYDNWVATKMLLMKEHLMGLILSFGAA